MHFIQRNIWNQLFFTHNYHTDYLCWWLTKNCILNYPSVVWNFFQFFLTQMLWFSKIFKIWKWIWSFGMGITPHTKPDVVQRCELEVHIILACQYWEYFGPCRAQDLFQKDVCTQVSVLALREVYRTNCI